MKREDFFDSFFKLLQKTTEVSGILTPFIQVIQLPVQYAVVDNNKKKSPIFVYGELLPYRFQQKQRPWSSLKKILLHSTICFAVVCLVVKLVLRNGQTGRSLCIRIPNTDPILICVDPYSEKLRNTDPIGIWINDTVLRRTNSRLLPFQRTLTCCHVAVVASPDHYWVFFWFFLWPQKCRTAPDTHFLHVVPDRDVKVSFKIHDCYITLP